MPSVSDQKTAHLDWRNNKGNESGKSRNKKRGNVKREESLGESRGRPGSTMMTSLSNLSCCPSALVTSSSAKA